MVSQSLNNQNLNSTRNKENNRKMWLGCSGFPGGPPQAPPTDLPIGFSIAVSLSLSQAHLHYHRLRPLSQAHLLYRSHPFAIAGSLSLSPLSVLSRRLLSLSKSACLDRGLFSSIAGLRNRGVLYPSQKHKSLHNNVNEVSSSKTSSIFWFPKMVGPIQPLH